MKLTTRQLRSLIKEEISKTLNESVFRSGAALTVDNYEDLVPGEYYHVKVGRDMMDPSPTKLYKFVSSKNTPWVSAQFISDDGDRLVASEDGENAKQTVADDIYLKAPAPIRSRRHKVYVREDV